MPAAPFPPAAKLLIALCALAGAVTVIAVFYRQNTVVFSILGLVAFLALHRCRWQPAAIVPFAVGAVLGPAMEMILIRTGTWTYANPSFAGIPAWLPLLWGLTALALTRISRWLCLLLPLQGEV